MYIIIDKLSSHAPNSVLVPCIAIEPGPRKVEAGIYHCNTWRPKHWKSLSEVASWDNL